MSALAPAGAPRCGSYRPCPHMLALAPARTSICHRCHQASEATAVTRPQKPQLVDNLVGTKKVWGCAGSRRWAFLKMGWAMWWVLKWGGQTCGWGYGTDQCAVCVPAVLFSCKDPPRGYVPLRPPELVVVCLHMLALAPVPAGQTMRERTGIQEPPLVPPPHVPGISWCCSWDRVGSGRAG